MSTAIPPQGQPPVAKKTSIWVWILGGIAVFLFAITLTCGIIGYMGMRMIKSAGFDSELMQKNPGLAMAKMVTAMNKDYETVKTNDREGTITVREKSTGKIITLKFDPQNKKMVVVDDDGKTSTVAITGNDATSGVSVESADGSSVKFGNAANNAPSWVPIYPGTTATGAVSTNTAEGSQNTFGFKSKDSAAQIMTYYTDTLKAAGFTIGQTITSDKGGMLSATEDASKRTIIVTVGATSEGSEGTVSAIQKK